MQLPPPARDLPLAGARLVGRVAEVDLVVQVATLRGHPRLLGLQALQLPTNVLGARFVHGACIG
ncbi:MAG TPA: hypothetical protein VGK68_02485 [Gaiellaceae bacterium]